VHRFLDRIWRLSDRGVSDDPPPKELEKLLHKTIKKVTEDTSQLEFNTAIAQMMIFINELFKADALYRALWDPFLRVLSPYAPHIADELWERMGNDPSISHAPWPEYDETLTVDEEVTVVVQINGKVRSKFTMAAGTASEDMETLALGAERIGDLTEGKQIVKVITVPDKLVNIVAK
jgi:leucyl-tRNA synthetase